jgi:hypothetical protein
MHLENLYLGNLSQTIYLFPHPIQHQPYLVNAYKSKRPADFNEADKPFYLAAATNVNAPDDKQQWFVRFPVAVGKKTHDLRTMLTTWYFIHAWFTFPRVS